MKNVILHFPYEIVKELSSGSQIRPVKMIDAFISSGYKVDLIIGNATDRKKKIYEIKKNIKNGIRYEFVYSESSTMPTLLTERHHYPTHPFLDFGFLKFCKKNNIRIGLFYRDIYWMLGNSPDNKNNIKRKIAKLFYLYDLYSYKKYVDVLYVPSIRMYKLMNYDFTGRVLSLPPGGEIQSNYYHRDNDSIISIGLNEYYLSETHKRTL
jgi:hypothetical protein